MLPYFRRTEDFVHGADAAHGAGGEWRVEEPRVAWAILDAFRDAAAAVGIAPIADFNRGDNEGCGYFHVNQKAGVRWSTAKAFLQPVRRRPNLMVATGAQATAILGHGVRLIAHMRAQIQARERPHTDPADTQRHCRAHVARRGPLRLDPLDVAHRHPGVAAASAANVASSARMSSGSGEAHSIGLPPMGCANASLAACSA